MDIPGLARLAADSGGGRWRGAAIAFGLTAAAAAARALIGLSDPAAAPFPTFYVSSMLATLLGGPWAGWLAMAVATLAGWWLFLPPAWPGASGWEVLVNLALFASTQAAVVLLAIGLRMALARAAAAEAALGAKVAELETLMDLVPVGIWFARAGEARAITCNRFAASLLGIPPGGDGSATRQPHVEIRRDGRPAAPETLPLQRALRGEESRNEEHEAVFRDGSVITLLSNAQPVRDAAGRITGAVSASLDITALKRTEAALREALAAREMLQREADHRIKNSLQLVTGVLRAQRGRLRDAAAGALLDEALARVNAVAQAHAALQASPDFRTTEAGHMLEELCGFVGRLSPTVTIACRREGDTTLDVERAIPLGLVVSELLTNAVRHAYPPGEPGRVELRVAGAPGGGLEVEVRDHGIGLQPARHREGSLGRDLVRVLAAQIGAEVATASVPGQGTVVTLRLRRDPPAAARRVETARADPG